MFATSYPVDMTVTLTPDPVAYEAHTVDSAPQSSTCQALSASRFFPVSSLRARSSLLFLCRVYDIRSSGSSQVAKVGRIPVPRCVSRHWPPSS